eukprot:g18928.t1
MPTIGGVHYMCSDGALSKRMPKTFGPVGGLHPWRRQKERKGNPRKLLYAGASRCLSHGKSGQGKEEETLTATVANMTTKLPMCPRFPAELTE